MKEPNMRARVSQLHKTEAEWNKLLTFVPIAGEFIIFDPDDQYSYARLKLGDGQTLLKDLPFFIDAALVERIIQWRYNEIIDAGRVTEYK